MRAREILLGLGVAILVCASAADAGATPLQARMDIPQLGGARLDLGAPSSGTVVEPIIDFSADGGLAETGSLSPSPLFGQGLMRPSPSGALQQPSISDLPGSSGPVSTVRPVETYREILSGASGWLPTPGVGLDLAANRENRSGDAAPQRTDDTNDDQQVTLKDLVRLLINRPENLGLEAPVLGPAGVAPGGVVGPATPQGDSILSAILSITVDMEIVQSISKVLKPSVDLNGVVALNVFGLREIALLVSPSSNSIRLVDLGSGRSMSFRYEDRGDGSPARGRGNAGPPGIPQSMSERENLLPTIIVAIRHWISTYVFNGVTLISLLALSVFWVVWRFARGETE